MPNATIECRGVWKIFGDREREALAAVRSRGIGKGEVFAEFGCVVGVRDVSFEVAEGEIFCIMGLSGSGKSTLIRHVNRLIDPSAGEVLVEGVDVNSLVPEALRELRSNRIGMVFQNMALLPHRTVRDNVALGLELRGVDKAARSATAESTLERVELAGWGERYPDELSGGMKQRVGLARALAADPHILLMDEPFSALDPLIRRELQQEFMTLASQMNKTTLFITHDLDEAIRIGRRIAIMKDGLLVQIGTPEDIVTNPKDDYVAEGIRCGDIQAQSRDGPQDHGVAGGLRGKARSNRRSGLPHGSAGGQSGSPRRPRHQEPAPHRRRRRWKNRGHRDQPGLAARHPGPTIGKRVHGNGP